MRFDAQVDARVDWFDRGLPLGFVQRVKTLSEAEAGGRFAAIIDEVASHGKPIAITRDGVQKAVLVGSDEFAAIEETLHLLATPANAERLRQGLADFSAGKSRAGQLCD